MRAALYFEMLPVEVQVKLYVESFDAFSPLSFYCNKAMNMRYLLDKISILHHLASFIHVSVIFIFFFKEFSLPRRAMEDLVETALIESLLHQLYLHCEGEARGGHVQSVPHFISV